MTYQKTPTKQFMVFNFLALCKKADNYYYQTVAFFSIIFFLLNFSSAFAVILPDDPFYIYPIAAKYDSLLQTRIKEYNIPGAACVLVSQDALVYKKCFGVRDLHYNEPVTEHTLFRLASLSKGFTAILTGLLVEKQLLDWDEPISDFLPGFKLVTNSQYSEPTLRHILSHTSGLPSYAGTELLEENMSYTELLGSLCKVPPVAPPGQQYNYQNVVFSIMGDILAAVTDTSYKALVNSLLFAPLGLKDATIGYRDFINRPDHASPHIEINSVQIPVEVKTSYYHIAPAAGINASINDMAVWIKVILGYRPEIISRSVLQQVTQIQIPTEKATRYFGKWPLLGDTSYALGWRIFDYNGVRLVYHGGSVQGFRTEIAVDPVNHLGIAFLFNCETPFADICVPEFFDLYMSLISVNQ
ncbi:MAG TPA: serine hydrolase domain-containing protein [bacterium]|nr:serine hydrolase domain-containing protein [bacterium]HPN43458.1 serine hydrolase domain-containing protein [bacterium]